MKICIDKLTFFTVIILVLTTLLSVAVNADMGPKASVRVNFENMGDELCYGTLLSDDPSTGPNSVWDGVDGHECLGGLDPDIWRAFAEYKDSDGFYYLQINWEVSKTKEIAWTYYPPDTFKILLYYPETQTFIVSDIYEKYAFDTYYTVDMEGVDIKSVEYDEELSSDERIKAYRTYNYMRELVSLVVRIVLTIVVEMGVACLFGFTKKKQLLLLVLVNTVTQIILNVLLNVINYNSGELAFVLNYVLFEIIVFVLEAVIYCAYLERFGDKPLKNGYFIFYALVANTVSFGVGLAVANILPGIF